MKKTTHTQLQNTTYRMMSLKSSLAEFERDLTGENDCFRTLIDGEDGNTDPEKLEALIGELMDNLTRYRKEFAKNELSDWETDMYYDFLYIAMQITRTRQNNLYPHFGLTEPAKTFGDIIDIAEEATKGTKEITSYRELLKTLYFSYRWNQKSEEILRFGVVQNSSFTGRVPRLCYDVLNFLRELDGDKFYNVLTTVPMSPETRTELCKQYNYENNTPPEIADFHTNIMKDPKAWFKQVVDATNEYYEELAREDMEWELYGIPDPYEDEANRRAKIYEALRAMRAEGRDDYENNEILKDEYPEEIAGYLYSIELSDIYENRDICRRHVADPDELHRHFLRFIELYFDHDHSTPKLSGDVTAAVFMYLIEHGHAVLADDDKYGLVMYQLDKALKRVKFEAERVKKLDD